MLNRLNVAAVAAEFLGTSVLVMMALVLTQTTAVSYFIATSVGVTLLTVFLLFGSISGGHFNPAITFGLWTARRIGTLRGVAYIAAQMLGGVASWQLYQYLTDKALPTKTLTYSTPMWLAEVVGTFVLAVAFTAAVTRAFTALESALAYGAAYFVGMMIAAVSAAGYINPAIALGVRSWSTVYVLGPLVGGLIGVNLYQWLIAPSVPRWRAIRLRRRA